MHVGNRIPCKQRWLHIIENDCPSSAISKLRLPHKKCVIATFRAILERERPRVEIVLEALLYKTIPKARCKKSQEFRARDVQRLTRIGIAMWLKRAREPQ